MNKKSSYKQKKYPDIIYQNRALCKAVSNLPTTPLIRIPSVYISRLPMIIGAATILVILLIPSTRNYSTNFFEKTSSEFSLKSNELKMELLGSLNIGLDSYVVKVREGINVLPIDSDLDSKKYLGRASVQERDKKQFKTLSEKTHLMTAIISQSLDYLR